MAKMLLWNFLMLLGLYVRHAYIAIRSDNNSASHKNFPRRYYKKFSLFSDLKELVDFRMMPERRQSVDRT